MSGVVKLQDFVGTHVRSGVFLPCTVAVLRRPARNALEETFFLIEQAQQADFVKGVVGWVDFRANNIAACLDEFRQFGIVKGFRHIVQKEPDGFMLDRAFLQGIAQLAAHNFTYDILIFPHQLQEATAFVKQLPNQQFVLDHLAKPYIKAGLIDAWEADLKALAQYENVSCKISAMVTEADLTAWKPSDFAPYIAVAFEAFGADRVMFG